MCQLMEAGTDAEALIARVVLGEIFLVAGIAKLPRLDQFEAAVRRYELLPAPVVRPLARLLPYVEVIGAILLLAGFFTRVCAGVLLGLLALFTAAVAVNLLRGREMDCGCFGEAAAKKLTWVTVARNSALAGGAALVLMTDPAQLSVDSELFRIGESALTVSASLAWASTTTVAVLAVALISAAAAVVRLMRVVPLS